MSLRLNIQEPLPQNMIGSVFTWLRVPVSAFVHKGLGLAEQGEDDTSAEVRAPLPPENNQLQVIKDKSGITSQDQLRQQIRSDLSREDCEEIGPCPPLKSIMNRSRPSSRRQSNIAGI